MRKKGISSLWAKSNLHQFCCQWPCLLMDIALYLGWNEMSHKDQQDHVPYTAEKHAWSHISMLHTGPKALGKRVTNDDDNAVWVLCDGSQIVVVAASSSHLQHEWWRDVSRISGPENAPQLQHQLHPFTCDISPMHGCNLEDSGMGRNMRVMQWDARMHWDALRRIEAPQTTEIWSIYTVFRMS